MGEAQEFVAGAEGVGQGGVVGDDRVLAGHRVLVDDEAAADRVVGLLQQGRAGGVIREERHAVGVVGQGAAAVEDEFGGFVEVDLMGGAYFRPEQAQALGGADALDLVVGGFDVHGAGGVAFEAEEDGLGGAVAVAGGAQGAEEFGADADRLGEQAVLLEASDEHPGGAHRADGVGAGGADADGEEVEDGDGHGG